MTQNNNYTINIDSTKRDGKIVSLLNNGNIIDTLEGEIDIVESINTLLTRNNLDLKQDIKEVVPNTGPGSFTGIKVGLTIANTLNWTFGSGKTYEPNYGGEPNITISPKL